MYIFFKRLFDIACSLIGIVGTSPFWLIAILGIEFSDPGPIFYVAKRIGKNNREFKMFKFRSMKIVKNADESNFKADTNRIFPFGRFIRATKIDELPQLLNILFGNMSIVGPRPASIDQVDEVRSGENSITAEVIPGLTGPSALYDYIFGDSIENEEEYRIKVLPTRLALDVWYVKNMGALIDLKMIWWTAICVLAEVFHIKTPNIYNTLINYVNVQNVKKAETVL